MYMFLGSVLSCVERDGLTVVGRDAIRERQEHKRERQESVIRRIKQSLMRQAASHPCRTHTTHTSLLP